MLISRPIHWTFGPLPEDPTSVKPYMAIIKEQKLGGWRSFVTTIYYATYRQDGWREIETDEEIEKDSVICWAEHPYENIRDVVQKVVDKLNDL